MDMVGSAHEEALAGTWNESCTKVTPIGRYVRDTVADSPDQTRGEVTSSETK